MGKGGEMGADGGCGWCRRAGSGMVSGGEVMGGDGFWILGSLEVFGCYGGRREACMAGGK
jgi:hypothetical protein